MIDRNARNQIAKLTRSFMNDEITAFEFDGALSEASKRTDDPTAQAVIQTLWFFYDDCKDHKIVASKPEWDVFNRLLLLLESDGEMETVKSWKKWHPLQGVAALLLVIFLVIAFRVGWGEHLIAYALPFGPLSMLIHWLYTRRRKSEINVRDIALMPFPSVRSLLATRRRVNNFMRQRYPEAIAHRRIRSPTSRALMWIPRNIAWCMFSPVVLFFQTLPDSESEVRIRLPESAD